MSATAVATIPLNLEADCGYGQCSELAWRFQRQLRTAQYSRGVSLMAVPRSLEEWRQDHRTARKRADRAQRLGYRFDAVDNSKFSDDIYAINTSLPVRQGRPMADGYTRRIERGPLPVYLCERHRTHTYGVLQGERLRAYLTLHRCGDLALVSMILGHGDHLRDDIMYLLFAGVVERHAGTGGFFYYNRHDSGTDGLVYFKERLGFRARDVEWVL